LARAKIASLVVNLWQKEVLPDGKFLANQPKRGVFLWQMSGKCLAKIGKLPPSWQYAANNTLLPDWQT